MLRWLWFSLVVIVLDQLTKLWMEASFRLYEIKAVTGFFNLTLVYNEGAAFSFLSDAGGWQRWFFVVLAAVISVVLINWLRQLHPSQKLMALGLSALVGGAIGNAIDRLLHGHVIDFLDFYIGDKHWPAFNVADSAIVLGVIIFIWDAFFQKPADNRSTEKQ